MSRAGELALVGLAGFVATALLARLAPRLGWTDAPRGDDAARKRQGRAVPAVGGLALSLALLPGGSLLEASTLGWGAWLPGPGVRALVLAAVVAVGALDDRRPLAPGPKSLAQLVALAPLALTSAQPGAGLALVVLGFLALNVLNTFDNADGAAALLCALGFAPVCAPVSAALLGFLPFNLDAARAANRASRAPTAYLGDAGAFLLATLVLWRPEAAGILWLPFLDLARLSCVRWREGSRPWLGDRRHLAHRLEARGVSRPGTALLLAAIALPGLLAVPAACATARPALLALGLGLTALLFALALWRAPQPVPCPEGRASE